jgi:sugar O-acyltransferase (sialic acid O-acetyltransferase NeuD family)
MSKKKVAIYGASGFGREVSWLCEECNIQVICFIDDDIYKTGKYLNNLPVISCSQLFEHYSDLDVVVAIANPLIRNKIIDSLKIRGKNFKKVIHPGTKMSNFVSIGDGLVLCAGCTLTTNIDIGDHVQINLHCTIGHDVVIGDYTTLAPGVNVSGWVHLGKRVYVGTGATFVNGTEHNPLKISDDVVVGAGACVTKSLDSGTWIGVPAKMMHKR